jgi:hypothetical protein
LERGIGHFIYEVNKSHMKMSRGPMRSRNRK